MSGATGMRSGGGVPVPWPSVPKKGRLGGVPYPQFDKLVEKAPVEDVKLDELTATQPTVDPAEVTRFTREPPDVPKGKRNDRGMLVDLPTVYTRGGKDFILDGHHRLAAAVARGEETARVRRVDLDAYAGGVGRWALARTARD